MLTHDTGSRRTVCASNREGSITNRKYITCRVIEFTIGLIYAGAGGATGGVLLKGCFELLDRGREGGGVFRVCGVSEVERGMGVQGKVIQEWEMFTSVVSIRDDCMGADIEVKHVTIRRNERGSELFGDAYVSAALLCSEWRVSRGSE